MTFSPATKGRLAGLAILIGLVTAYFVRIELVKLSATDVQGDVALWLYAEDLAPGDRFDARAWVDDSLSRETIQAVRVYGPGPDRERVIWGDKDNDLDFTIEVPHDANEQIGLAIEVAYATSFGGLTKTFRVELPVYSKSTSQIRRGVKALLAIASWFALMFLDWARRRWYVRRHRRPNPAWALTLPLVAAAGWLWFAELLEHATRLHGWWISIPALAVWLLALVFSARRSRYSGMTSYLVEQVMVDVGSQDAFRSARNQIPIQALGDLELAWHGAGFAVDRVGKNLRLLLAGRGTVMIPLPASDSLGGEPFEIRASDDDIASVALHAVTPLLGELRAHAAGKRLTITSTDVTVR